MSKIYKCFFIDINGNIKEKLIDCENENKLFTSKITFDGSSVLGYSTIEKSDLTLIPDKNAIYKNKYNIVFCDAKYEADSRSFLKQAIKYAESCGYEIKIGAELEFYLFKKHNGVLQLNNLDTKGYMSCCSDRIHNFANEIYENIKSFGIPFEALHHECGKNQYEITFKYDNPLIIADHIILIKQQLKWLSEIYDNYVSFMPKPLQNMAGSGMHTNISIFKDEKNLFASDNGLSEIGYYFASGIMKHVKALTAFTCPSINSYKRINAGYEAPNKITISKTDRSALIRIPNASENATRIELRSPDISCNPYLTFASIIYAGIDGIKNKLNFNNSVDYLPKTLNESLSHLQNNELLNNIAPTIINNYIKVKNAEIEEFYHYITDWEIKKYL